MMTHLTPSHLCSFLPSRLAKCMAFLAVFVCCGLCSCENKRDQNGDLGGMWQLLEWRNAQNQVVQDKSSRIFYSVQLQLIRLRNYETDKGDYYQCYFRHTPDSLINDLIIHDGQADSLNTNDGEWGDSATIVEEEIL